MKINLLRDVDDQERAILLTIFETQLEESKGISWGELLERPAIEKKMSRQTFSHRLKGLLQRQLLEKEVIKNKKGKPTLYRLNSKFFGELREIRARFYPWNVESEIQKFQKDIESWNTERYVEAMMELAFGRLNALAIALTCFDMDGARWMFYDATYRNIEQILRYVLDRASKGKNEKEQTLEKLFELLKSYAERPIGKRFGLDDVCNSRQEIIRIISKRQ